MKFVEDPANRSSPAAAMLTTRPTVLTNNSSRAISCMTMLPSEYNNNKVLHKYETQPQQHQRQTVSAGHSRHSLAAMTSIRFTKFQ